MNEILAPRYAPVGTPLGPGWFAYTSRGVVLLSANCTERAFLAEARDALGVKPVRKEPQATFARAVRDSIARGDGSVVDWTMLSPFQRTVLQATAKIPVGAVRSYADLARAIRKPRAQRAVGTALARNPVPLMVPCHRVVRSDGSLGNYGLGGTDVKRALLAREGYRSA